jgi:chromatin remodeling complex protein RSC6
MPRKSQSSETSQRRRRARKTTPPQAETVETTPAQTATTNEVVTVETPSVSSPSSRSGVDVATVVDTFLSEVANIREQFSQLRSRFNELRTSFTEFNSNLTAFDKLSSRTIKAVQKARRRRTNGNHTPSGFNKPTSISSELAAFLNKPADVQMSRTDVTRALSAYIKEHNLQNPENRKFIVPDEPLASLLRINRDETLSYFNLQKHLKHLFVSGEQTQQSA